jgi:3-methyladenine DNA glycosylase/8-oxoguanine DNA glycosylase
MPPPSADIILPARGPYDLRATVLSHGGWRLPPWSWTDGARPSLRRAEVLADGGVRLLAIRPAPDGVVLRVTGRGAAEPEVLAPLAARVRTALQLDTDLRPFHRWCRTQSELRPAADLRLGRFLRGTTLFEDLVTTIVCQRAPRHAERLGLLGPRCPADRRLRAFPTPERLAEVGVRGLRLLGLGAASAPVVRLARDVASGRLDLFALERASLRSVRAVPGLDASAAGWVALLLGHADRGLVDARSARRLAAWAPWRGLALWCALWLACPLPEQQRLRATPTRRRRPASRSRRS